MLTSNELNALQGFLHYLNDNLGAGLVTEDIVVKNEEGTPTALVGYEEGNYGQYILKEIY